MLDFETARRKHVSDVLLQKIAGLLDPGTWGATLDSAPAPLAAALRGEAPGTWGAATRPRHDDTLYYVVPTPQGSQGRVLTVSLGLVLDRGRVVQGLLQGEDLFVLWSEAMLVRVLDPTSAADRALAAATVTDVLSGALEATLPAARCARRPGEGELLARACDGWAVSVRMGAEQGEVDVVDVVGPAPKAPEPPPKKAPRARGAGMR